MHICTAADSYNSLSTCNLLQLNNCLMTHYHYY
ncbi:hypothetical protein M5D96_000174 [Drosophila gunungcola]|uniref:Uncharacterized protein n=1 Tax=Drosophila gunungcola TaxID=103775 RepID=A0A9P9YW63_9MUSC|nr:hypothetical protein M5D96_000174 [Drosophila gunungcola]